MKRVLRRSVRPLGFNLRVTLLKVLLPNSTQNAFVGKALWTPVGELRAFPVRVESSEISAEFTVIFPKYLDLRNNSAKRTF